jgi:hypothetical protein
MPKALAEEFKDKVWELVEDINEEPDEDDDCGDEGEV